MNLTENCNGGGQFSVANQWGLIARFYSLRDIATDLMVWRGFVFNSCEFVSVANHIGPSWVISLILFAVDEKKSKVHQKQMIIDVFMIKKNVPVTLILRWKPKNTTGCRGVKARWTSVSGEICSDFFSGECNTQVPIDVKIKST